LLRLRLAALHRLRGMLCAARPWTQEALLRRRLGDVVRIEPGERKVGIVDDDLADLGRRDRAHVDVLLTRIGVVLDLLALLLVRELAELLPMERDLLVDLAP